MSIVVTGAAGFIGSHLVRRLADRGEEVVAVDVRPAPSARWRHLVLDLADREAVPVLARLTHGAGAVVHLASRTGVRSTAPDIERLRERDIVIATDHVLAAVPAGVPLVVASSSSVYGGAQVVGGRLRASRESDALRPRGGYARAKARMESRAHGRVDAGGRLAVVRPFTVVGEGQRDDMALATWIEQARLGLPLRVLGSLDRRRDLTDVRGVVDAIVALVDSGRTGTYNLGSGRPRTLAEMIEAIQRVVGAAGPVSVVEASTEEVPATFADSSLLRTTFGLDLGTDLDDVVERQLRWVVDDATASVA